MIKLTIGAALCALLLAATPAWAQSYTDSHGTAVAAFVPLGGCPAGGGNCTGPQGTPSAPTSTAPNPYPAGAVPETISAAGATTAFTATLAAASGKLTYLCGFTVNADATAATVVALTVTGTVTGTLNYRESVGAVASGTGTTTQNYHPCIPASAVNTPIIINAGAAGTAGNATISAWGFQL